MSGEFDWKKDSQWAKFNWRPQIFVKLSFIELCDSKLSGLHGFNIMDIILSLNRLKNREEKVER